jgi:hypothetical protein
VVSGPPAGKISGSLQDAKLRCYIRGLEVEFYDRYCYFPFGPISHYNFNIPGSDGKSLNWPDDLAQDFKDSHPFGRSEDKIDVAKDL